MADGIRTRDHRDHNPGLYQLSYGHLAAASIPARETTSRSDTSESSPGTWCNSSVWSAVQAVVSSRASSRVLSLVFSVLIEHGFQGVG